MLDMEGKVTTPKATETERRSCQKPYWYGPIVWSVMRVAANPRSLRTLSPANAARSPRREAQNVNSRFASPSCRSPGRSAPLDVLLRIPGQWQTTETLPSSQPCRHDGSCRFHNPRISSCSFLTWRLFTQERCSLARNAAPLPSRSTPSKTYRCV